LEGFLHYGMHLRGVSHFVANLPPTWSCAFEGIGCWPHQLDSSKYKRSTIGLLWKDVGHNGGLASNGEEDDDAQIGTPFGSEAALIHQVSLFLNLLGLGIRIHTSVLALSNAEFAAEPGRLYYHHKSSTP
jgi:hypothetical protein